MLLSPNNLFLANNCTSIPGETIVFETVTKVQFDPFPALAPIENKNSIEQNSSLTSHQKMLWFENVLNNLSCSFGRSCEQGCAFLHNSPRCQVTAFTCNWICATMQPGLQSERKLFFHFFLGSFWGTHISIVIVARQDETCFLIKVFLINFKFVLVNTQRMQYCTMRCHCPTIQLCHDTIMQLCLLCPAIQLQAERSQ